MDSRVALHHLCCRRSICNCEIPQWKHEAVTAEMRSKNVFYIIAFIFVVWNLLTYMTLVTKPSQPVLKGNELRTRLDQVEAALQVQLEFNRALLKELQKEKAAVQDVVVPNNAVSKSLPVAPIDKNKVPVPPQDPHPVVDDRNNSEPANVIPVLVIACNRPDAIRRSLDQLIGLPHDPLKHPIIVSQDCGDAKTADAVRSYGTKVQLLQHTDNSEIKLETKAKKFIGYYKIARHYKWALSQVFDVLNHQAVIIVEDDLDIAPDFYEYFDATYPILHSDPSLWCVSAWNDNGKADKVADAPELLYRTDFFPGLGWMLEKNVWNELKTKWPATFWDDWMRHPDQRKERACIRPEVCRTKTFGAKGVSKGQFYNKYLKFIKLNDKKIEFTKTDLSYLMKSTYDAKFVQDVYGTKVVTITEAMGGNFAAGESVRVQYSDKDTFKRYAKSLGIMEDLKAGVPRAGYRGVVPVIIRNTRVYVAPPSSWTGYDPKWN